MTMAMASSSTSAVSAIRSGAKTAGKRYLSHGIQQRPASRSSSSESFESPRVTPYRQYSSPDYSPPPPPTSTTLDRLPQSTPRQYTRQPHTYNPSTLTHRPAPGASTTPSTAQSFFTNLLSLPPTRPLPSDLSLQILTHKSYRYAQNPRSSPIHTSTPDVENEVWQWAANHNGRLGFLGRRAMASYLAMFYHSALAGSRATGSGSGLGLGLVRDGGLEDRLDGLMDTSRIGRYVGDDWEMDELLRWDGNENGISSGLVKIKGQAVEATLGAVFTYYGSPAAHRAYHLHVLPRLKDRLGDPSLAEKAESMKENLRKEFGGGILPRE